MNLAELNQLMAGDGDWSPVVDTAEQARLQRALAATPAGRQAAAGISGLSVRPLPFYRRVRFYRATLAGTMPPLELRFLATGDRLFVLDGTAVPIREANRLDGLGLDAGTAAAYLAFFFAETRGDGPGFRLVGRLDDVPFTGAAGDDDRRRVAALLAPLAVKGQSAGGVVLEGTILYGNALLSATYVVSPEGEVTTMGEKLLADHLPAEARPAHW